MELLKGNPRAKGKSVPYDHRQMGRMSLPTLHIPLASFSLTLPYEKAMKGSEIPIRKLNRGRKRWLVDARYVGGKREFFATEAEARSVRQQRLIDMRKHGMAALDLSQDERIDFARAKGELQEVGATVRDAVNFYLKHHHAIKPILFSDAIEQTYAAKKATNKDDEYIRKFKATLESLMLASGGDRELSLVSRDDIEGWLWGNGWKQDTIRNKRTDVRTFFKYAMGRNWITLNPADKIEYVERSDKPPGILTPDEAEAALRGCHAEFLPYLAISLLCGVRCSEVVRLNQDNLQIERGYVEVPAFRGDEKIAKSRKRRIVQLSENAKVWLKDAKISPRNEKWFARQLPVVREGAAKILGRPMPWPKNCLRHSFASYHLAMHESADKTALQMGHRSTTMLFEHYRELVTKEDAERFWGILPL
jgi:integrase